MHKGPSVVLYFGCSIMYATVMGHRSTLVTRMHAEARMPQRNWKLGDTSVGSVCHNVLDVGTCIFYHKGQSNDIIAVKYPKTDKNYTICCSPVDVSFQKEREIPNWNEKSVTVAVGNKSFKLSLNELTSSNVCAFHKAKDKVSRELEALQLADGPNAVTFSLRDEVVTARIFLWNVETVRLVVVDVDGTISKSDLCAVIGVTEVETEFWTRRGAVALFSRIENLGYKLIYLSARPKGFAEKTRKFLREEVKQCGARLPVGPVFVAQIGVVDAGIQYVMGKQAESKIHVLQGIQDMFPEGCNPFHAGFGDTDSDRISYRSAKIPVDHIFPINSKDCYEQILASSMHLFPPVEGEASTSRKLLGFSWSWSWFWFWD